MRIDSSNISAIATIIGVVVALIAIPEDRWIALRLRTRALHPALSAVIGRARSWLWIFIAWGVLRLLLSPWAGKAISLLLPYARTFWSSIAAWASIHPIEMFLVFAGVYSIAVVTDTRRFIASAIKRSVTTNAPPEVGTPRATVNTDDIIRSRAPNPVKLAAQLGRAETIFATLADELEQSSPDSVRIRIRVFHQPESGIDGLLMSIVNDGIKPIKINKASVVASKSFDATRMTFREDLTGHATLPPFDDVNPSFESNSQWFIRISKGGGHMEIGNTHGQGVLTWPNRDPTPIQIWLLTVYIEVQKKLNATETETFAPWQFPVRLAWKRPNQIKVGSP